MAGGLLNLIAVGDQNIILNGNPSKSFFKFKHVKYTNFGLQKYRIDQNGQTNINMNTESKFTFKIPRYADLLMETYLVLNLPNIWSPIFKHINNNGNTEYRPYEFKWIKNIGTQIIKEINITIGGHIIQKFSGNYLQNLVERSFNGTLKNNFNKMIGNVNELNDPANFSNRNNNYPSAWKDDDSSIELIEPSIRQQKLFIPINTWFTLSSTMALPLICLQYSELVIDITLRPVVELFTIKDVIYESLDSNFDNYDKIPQIQALQNVSEAYGFYRFINQPPKNIIDLSSNIYQDKRTNWNSDIHLICTQCFLDNEERLLFSQNTQNYLIKQIYEYNFERVNKSSKIKLESNGLVSSWMWYFQRNDVNLRNEWSNYTNWPYENIIPNNLNLLTISGEKIYYSQNKSYSIDDTSKNIYITGNQPDTYSQSNQKQIMKDFAIICDGKYRENSLPDGVFEKIENYIKNNGTGKDGLYFYNFCLNNDAFKFQPNGAFNTNKFKTIELEYNNYENPPIDFSNVQFSTICDPETGEEIATTKDPTSIYKYYYNLYVMEERYNILQFQSGTADLIYSR